MAASDAACAAWCRYQMKDPSEGNKKALHAAMLEVWKEECKTAIQYGHGPALTTNQTAFGCVQCQPVTCRAQNMHVAAM